MEEKRSEGRDLIYNLLAGRLERVSRIKVGFYKKGRNDGIVRSLLSAHTPEK